MKKKKLLVAIFGLFFTPIFAQQSIIDFENFQLSQVESYYNGSDFNGGFSTNSFGNELHFSNDFDTTWGEYWTGFSYSNVTNNTLSGITNQYSCYPGMGANNSSNYAIYYQNGLLNFSQNTRIDSIKISNSTYAALSMKNGDAFGKKFGDSTNASGEIDNTNGNDFFKIWIIALDQNSNKIDSVEFYLADYRFSDDNDNYIIDSWVNIDLSNFGSNVRNLTFRFESSDMSFGYINTPSYFALDDIHFTNVLSDLHENSSDLIQTFPNPIVDKLTINGLFGDLTVKNINGVEIYSKEHHFNSIIDFTNFEKGIYFISIVNENQIVTKKIIF